MNRETFLDLTGGSAPFYDENISVLATGDLTSSAVTPKSATSSAGKRAKKKLSERRGESSQAEALSTSVRPPPPEPPESLKDLMQSPSAQDNGRRSLASGGGSNIIFAPDDGGEEGGEGEEGEDRKDLGPLEAAGEETNSSASRNLMDQISGAGTEEEGGERLEVDQKVGASSATLIARKLTKKEEAARYYTQLLAVLYNPKSTDHIKFILWVQKEQVIRNIVVAHHPKQPLLMRRSNAAGNNHHYRDGKVVEETQTGGGNDVGGGDGGRRDWETLSKILLKLQDISNPFYLSHEFHSCKRELEKEALAEREAVEKLEKELSQLRSSSGMPSLTTSLPESELISKRKTVKPPPPPAPAESPGGSGVKNDSMSKLSSDDSDEEGDDGTESVPKLVNIHCKATRNAGTGIYRPGLDSCLPSGDGIVRYLLDVKTSQRNIPTEDGKSEERRTAEKEHPGFKLVNPHLKAWSTSISSLICDTTLLTCFARATPTTSSPSTSSVGDNVARENEEDASTSNRSCGQVQDGQPIPPSRDEEKKKSKSKSKKTTTGDNNKTSSSSSSSSSVVIFPGDLMKNQQRLQVYPRISAKAAKHQAALRLLDDPGSATQKYKLFNQMCARFGLKTVEEKIKANERRTGFIHQISGAVMESTAWDVSLPFIMRQVVAPFCAQRWPEKFNGGTNLTAAHEFVMENLICYPQVTWSTLPPKFLGVEGRRPPIGCTTEEYLEEWKRREGGRSYGGMMPTPVTSTPTTTSTTNVSTTGVASGKMSGKATTQASSSPPTLASTAAPVVDGLFPPEIVREDSSGASNNTCANIIDGATGPANSNNSCSSTSATTHSPVATPRTDLPNRFILVRNVEVMTWMFSGKAGIQTRPGLTTISELDFVIVDSYSGDILFVVEVKRNAADLVFARNQRERLAEALRKDLKRLDDAALGKLEPSIPGYKGTTTRSNTSAGLVVVGPSTSSSIRSQSLSPSSAASPPTSSPPSSVHQPPPTPPVSQLLFRVNGILWPDVSSENFRKYFIKSPIHHFVFVSRGDLPVKGSNHQDDDDLKKDDKTMSSLEVADDEDTRKQKELLEAKFSTLTEEQGGNVKSAADSEYRINNGIEKQHPVEVPLRSLPVAGKLKWRVVELLATAAATTKVVLETKKTSSSSGGDPESPHHEICQSPVKTPYDNVEEYPVVTIVDPYIGKLVSSSLRKVWTQCQEKAIPIGELVTPEEMFVELEEAKALNMVVLVPQSTARDKEGHLFENPVTTVG